MPGNEPIVANGGWVEVERKTSTKPRTEAFVILTLAWFPIALTAFSIYTTTSWHSPSSFLEWIGFCIMAINPALLLVTIAVFLKEKLVPARTIGTRIISNPTANPRNLY